MVWWVLFKKAFSNLSSYADLSGTAEGSHAVFISPILPLKWSTICYDEKCPVLSDQPSLTTNRFSGVLSLCSDWSPWSVAVLPPALLSRKCFCEPRALSTECRTDTHAPLGTARGCKRGMGGTAWTQEGWGCLHGAPPSPLGQLSLSGSLVPLGWGNLPGWRRGHAETLKVLQKQPWQPGCTSGQAGPSSGCTSAEAAVQQAAVVGVILTATKSAQPGPGRLGVPDSGQRTEGMSDSPLGRKIYWKSRCSHFSQLSWDFF